MFRPTVKASLFSRSSGLLVLALDRVHHVAQPGMATQVGYCGPTVWIRLDADADNVLAFDRQAVPHALAVFACLHGVGVAKQALAAQEDGKQDAERPDFGCRAYVGLTQKDFRRSKTKRAKETGVARLLGQAAVPGCS